MNIPQNFIKNILQLVADTLCKTGWTKHKSGIFSYDLNEDVYGCIALNRAFYRKSIWEINPIVSVGSKSVEKLIAELKEIKFEPYTTACLGMNVGYLMPEAKYIAWSFQEGMNYEASVTEMIAIIEKFGQPFIKQNAMLTTLYDTLHNSKRGIPPDPFDYRIATVAYLLGKRTETEIFLGARLQEIGNRNDEAAELFKKFALNFRKLMGIMRDSP